MLPKGPPTAARPLAGLVRMRDGVSGGPPRIFLRAMGIPPLRAIPRRGSRRSKRTGGKERRTAAPLRASARFFASSAREREGEARRCDAMRCDAMRSQAPKYPQWGMRSIGTGRLRAPAVSTWPRFATGQAVFRGSFARSLRPYFEARVCRQSPDLGPSTRRRPVRVSIACDGHLCRRRN